MNLNGLAHRKAIGVRFGERIAAGDAVFQLGVGGIGGLPCASFDGTDRQFSGSNLVVLLQVMKDYGWKDPRFFTLRQIKEANYSLSPKAKGFELQFLVGTGSDGFPLESPEVKRFKVFHASDVNGVSPWKIAEKFAAADVTQAVHDVVGGGLEINEIAANTALGICMAMMLIEAQVGVSFDEIVDYGNAYLVDDWVKGIEDDPLSFFRVIKDAEGLAAQVIGRVRDVALVREAEVAVANAMIVTDSAIVPTLPGMTGLRAELFMSKGMSRAEWIERRFQDREAVLAVPFAEKERVSALGAEFYSPQKLWFVPKGLAVDVFKEWNPCAYALGTIATRDVLLSSFSDAMVSIGVVPPSEIINDGRWHNVSVNTKRSAKKNTAGSYILSLDGARDGGAIGTIKNNDSGESFTWRYKGAFLTPEQRARLRAEGLEREIAAERAVLMLQDVAAGHAGEIWMAASEISGEGYVAKKGISGKGLRQIAGAVLLQYPEFVGESGKSVIRVNDVYTLVPMRNRDNELRAVQAISGDGVIKCFMRGAQKKGTMCVLGAESFPALCISEVATVAFAEGIATCDSFHEVTGLPVVVCFDAGNLEAVVSDVAKLLSRSTLAILSVATPHLQLPHPS